MWKAYTEGASIPAVVDQGKTVADGVAISDPYHGRAVMAAVERSKGMFLKVEEENIIPGQEKLAAEGLYVEPTSALVWNALEQISGKMPEPIIGIITGHGLKSS